VEQTPERVVIEASPGRVALPMSRVARVVASPSALAEFRERAMAVAPTDAGGWADLARWAETRELPTQAREAWEKVLGLQPGHPQANEALGRVQVDGRWLTADDAYRARGYVQYDGRWVTPEEHQALLRERAADDADRREREASVARAREAEARAAEAEAHAREAEAAASAPTEGIPYWWGIGGGGGHHPRGAERPSGSPDPPPAPHRPPVPSAPPNRIGGGSPPAPKPAGGLGPASADKPAPRP
ncbi:MAG: hypothetical protein U0599_28880, partial [Vicinamibacteria bacterium]